MPRPVDYFEAYDLAVRAGFSQIVAGMTLEKQPQIVLAPIDRAMIETRTTMEVGQARPKLPVISIYAGETYEFPEDRQSTALIRDLGYAPAHAVTKLSRRRARYPKMVRIPYTVDVYAETAREVHQFVQRFIFLQHRGYSWLAIDAGSPWGWKKATLIFGNAVQNTTNLESPDRHGSRLVRNTIPFNLEGWIFDQVITEALVARQILVKFMDTDSNPYETLYAPARHPLGTGDGIIKTFAETYGGELREYTVLATGTVGGLTVTGYDNGAGVISGTGISGTVNYATGAVSVTFVGAPDNGTAVEAAFYMEV